MIKAHNVCFMESGKGGTTSLLLYQLEIDGEFTDHEIIIDYLDRPTDIMEKLVRGVVHEINERMESDD